METVILVGAGIVNLVTAHELVCRGYDVAVYDRAPDPRADADWSEYGCTRGGGDGRMFTLTEADSYHNRSWNPDGTPNDLLNRPISDHGWRLAKPGSLTGPERRWAADFHGVSPRLADRYNDDIFEVNRAAGARWAELIAAEPELFGPGTGYSDGILRLYTEEDYFRWHVARNDRAGATRRVLTPGQITADYPALAAACERGSIVGGIEVVGFTVNIHAFLARLVDMLEPAAAFHWNAEATRVRWASPGVADGIELAGGEVVRGRHYVLSPGAYGHELLRGTASYEHIQGMLGVWFTVPNIEPRLEHSLKIARKGHRAEETNVTLATADGGEPVLACGAGYGWVGLRPGNIDPGELAVLFDSLEDTLRLLFPAAHAAGRDAGMLDASRRYCVRPWTPTCLGVFERLATADGGTLIVTGGHNTGGFAQSPAIAEAVLAAVEGREHMMHDRYSVSRRIT